MSRTTVRRGSFQPALAVMLCLGVGMALAACGGPEPETAGGGAAEADRSASGAPPAVAALDFESCAGFGIEDAARILGTAAGELEERSVQESWGKSCGWFRKGGAMSETAVAFTLNRSDSEDEASVEMAQLAENASVADQVLPNQRVTHWVEGVGDQALWVAANGSLYVRAGDVTIIVTQPGDEATQIEVARRVLG